MPDIRRMGSDYVVKINGKLYRCETYDQAYNLWEEYQEESEEE